MEKKLKNPNVRHAVNSWVSLIASIFIVCAVFWAVVFKILSEPTELVKEVGMQSFRMFTVLSNMFVAITAAITIPFAVDGIRDKNYHLPRWVINITFSSVTCVMLTFMISLFILSPNAGFVEIMLTTSNLVMHTLVPITAILVFLFVNIYHNVKFKTTFLALIPVLIYAILYFIMAIAVGEDDGGWRDHYQFQRLMPWYYVAILIMAIAFGLANLLKIVHNYMHRRDKAITQEYLHNSKEYDFETIEQAIEYIARENKKHDSAGELVVPRRTIKVLEKKYKSEKPLSYLCNVYVNEFLK